MQDRHASKGPGSPVCLARHTLKTHSLPKNLFIWEWASFGVLQSYLLPITHVDRCHENPCWGQSVYYLYIRAIQTDFFAVALFISDSDFDQFDPPS